MTTTTSNQITQKLAENQLKSGLNNMKNDMTSNIMNKDAMMMNGSN